MLVTAIACFAVACGEPSEGKKSDLDGDGGPGDGDSGGSDTDSGTAADSNGDDGGSGGDGTSAGGTLSDSAGDTTEGLEDGGATGDSGSADTSNTGGTSTTAGSTTAGSTGTTGQVDESCRKVDVVFSVDNSNSMQEEIAALTTQNIFNNMVDRLLNEVGNGGVEDFHFALMDACPKPARYHNWGAGGSCNFPLGFNYLVSTRSNPLDLTKVTCVADLEELTDNGYNGMTDSCIDAGAYKDDNEQPAFTAAQSLSEPDNGLFLRQDAVTFVIAMTDEDEEMIGLDPNSSPLLVAQDIVDMYTSAKGGSLDNIVFLGIGGGAGGCTGGVYGDAQDASELRAISTVFQNAGRGLFWDICDGDLAMAVDMAIDLVDSACIEPG